MGGGGDKNIVISGIPPLPPAPGILYHPSARFLPTYFLLLSGLPPQPSCSSELRAAARPQWMDSSCSSSVWVESASLSKPTTPSPRPSPWPVAADSCSGTPATQSQSQRFQAGSRQKEGQEPRAQWQGRQEKAQLSSQTLALRECPASGATELWMGQSVFLFTQMLVNYKATQPVLLNQTGILA